jgi:hypothetical protein
MLTLLAAFGWTPSGLCSDRIGKGRVNGETLILRPANDKRGAVMSMIHYDLRNLWR